MKKQKQNITKTQWVDHQPSGSPISLKHGIDSFSSVKHPLTLKNPSRLSTIFHLNEIDMACHCLCTESYIAIRVILTIRDRCFVLTLANTRRSNLNVDNMLYTCSSALFKYYDCQGKTASTFYFFFKHTA